MPTAGVVSRKRGSAQDTCLVLLAWFLEVFVAGQAILGGVEPSMAERTAIFVCRIFIYLGSMCRILYCGLPGPGFARKIRKECRKLWKVINIINHSG